MGNTDLESAYIDRNNSLVRICIPNGLLVSDFYPSKHVTLRILTHKYLKAWGELAGKKTLRRYLIFALEQFGLHRRIRWRKIYKKKNSHGTIGLSCE